MAQGHFGSVHCAEMEHFWRTPVNKLHHSGTATETFSRQAAIIRSMIDDLERTLHILYIDICAEEERVRVFDKADPLYPVLARTLGARSENLTATVAALRQRLKTLEAVTTQAAAEAA
jgi:hypothetical protein